MTLRLESIPRAFEKIPHVIFHSLNASMKKDESIALAAVVGAVFSLTILSIAMYYAATAVRHYLGQIPPDRASAQDRKTSKVAGVSSESEAWEKDIPASVKETLEQLFLGPCYLLDGLPIYPEEIKEGEPLMDKMASPLMKGFFCGRRPFIAIKVECILTDEEIEKQCFDKRIEERYKKGNRTIKELLVLFQSSTEKFVWDQLNRGQSMKPYFFTERFTHPQNGTGPTKNQEGNFKLVQKLLQDRQCRDIQGLTWYVST